MKFYQDKWFWLSVGVFVVLGLLSGVFAFDAQVYYKELTLPSFSPPGFLFGPVWFVLYILIGSVHYFIWQWKESRMRSIVISMFYLQFVLNVVWSLFFFTMRNTGVALVDISVLWLILFVLQALFFKYDKRNMWLMGPYFLWVSFASVLNIAIFMLN